MERTDLIAAIRRDETPDLQLPTATPNSSPGPFLVVLAKRGIIERFRRMLRATVPKTATHEYGTTTWLHSDIEHMLMFFILLLPWAKIKYRELERVI